MCGKMDGRIIKQEKHRTISKKADNKKNQEQLQAP